MNIGLQCCIVLGCGIGLHCCAVGCMALHGLNEECELGKLKPDQLRYEDTKLLESSKRDSKIDSQLPDTPKTDPVRPRRPGGMMGSIEGGFKKASLVPSVSVENAAMRDQMSTSGGSVQPIVANNVQTNNNASYVPIKADPRPSHRGSALDRYIDRIASYI